MASSMKKVKTKSVPTKVPDGCVLILSHEEARVLKIVLSHVGGSPDNTLRGYINLISDALEDAGYKFIDEEVDTAEGGTYFQPDALLDMQPTDRVLKSIW